MFKMFHNLLFHIISSRRGRKDNVPSRDCFYLYQIFLQSKTNLPSLIPNHWMNCLKQRSLNKVASQNSIPYVMLFISILKSYDHETELNFDHLCLYPPNEEITKATINKMRITDQLFLLVKLEESLGDICRESYRVGSQANPNVNPNSPFANFIEKIKEEHLKVMSNAAASGSNPSQTKPP